MKGALLLLVLVAGCRSHSRPPTPLTDALLAQGGDPGDPDGAAARATLAEATARVQRLRATRPGDPIEKVLAEVVFGTLGFEREVDDQSLNFQRLDEVLARRRGSCYGLTAVYLALGESLDLGPDSRLSAVLVPGHIFVRAGGRNIELLHRGAVEPDAWYQTKYQPPEGVSAYLRPLGDGEVLAVLDYNRGNDLRKRGQLGEAAAAYRRALLAFPGFAEARASLGLVLQLQGDLPAARTAYQGARAANPHLPGLEHNLKVLEDELSGRPGPRPSDRPATPGSP